MQYQLEKEHKDVMSALMVANRGKIRDLKYDHVTYLAEEKKKLWLQLITEHQRHNSLSNDVLDFHQDARVAIKAGTISNYLSSQRSKQMKEWRLKCIQLVRIKDDGATNPRVQCHHQWTKVYHSLNDSFDHCKTLGKDKESGNVLRSHGAECDKLIM